MDNLFTSRVVNKNGFAALLVALILCFPIVPGFNTEARANDAGAFVGGMVAAHVLGNAVRRDQVRTAAEVDQANSARQIAAQNQKAQPAAAASQTPQQRIAQLDKLAAGGYITPAEYKAKKKAIVDGM